MLKIYTYSTRIGSVTFGEKNGAISYLTTGEVGEEHIVLETPLIQEAYNQLNEYLNGTRTTFDFPINPQGTAFQLKVWKALCDIPYGEIRSYKQIAQAIGQPKAVRAVGMANHRNPLLIVIPCHRVIGSNGQLVGYTAGLTLKEHLLRLEKQSINIKNE